MFEDHPLHSKIVSHASIITVLELTTTLTGFINDVKHATREHVKVVIGASSIYSLLTSLRFWVEGARSDDTWFIQVKLLGTRIDHLANSKMFSKRWWNRYRHRGGEFWATGFHSNL
jgi:hypothetical protein